MLEIFYPDVYIDRIQHINLDLLAKNGIKGMILDIDNTLVPNHVKDADENVVNWIEKVKKAGFKICIVSNASKKRVIRFNQNLKVYAVHRAAKPSKKALLKATELMGIKPDETAIVGDQVFTDIYGGNRLGMFTILVRPIDKNEFFFVRLKRLGEKFILSRYVRLGKK